MQWDLAAQPHVVQNVAELVLQGYEIALRWVVSPAAWSQFAMLVVAYLLANFIARRLRTPLSRLLNPAEDSTSVLA